MLRIKFPREIKYHVRDFHCIIRVTTFKGGQGEGGCIISMYTAMTFERDKPLRYNSFPLPCNQFRTV